MRKLTTLFLAILMFFASSAYAGAAEFSLRPESGVIERGAKFTIDVLVDTLGEASNLARAVLTFDSDLIQVIKAQRNSSLYCTYPADEQSIDNTNGVVMLTGFCQSGVDTLYVTEDEPDVFARIQFEAIRTGSLILDWEYNGEDLPFKSVVMADGSPPLNVLDEKPVAGAFSIVNDTTPTPTPNTGYTLSIGMIITGVLLLVLGVAYVRYRDLLAAPKLKGRTVVVYGKED